MRSSTRSSSGIRPSEPERLFSSAPTVLESVGQAVQWGRERLAPSPTASLDAQLLLGHLLARDRSWILAHGEAPVSAEVATRYVSLVERRAQGEPVAYLRGRVHWFGGVLEVTPAVLVPRPETEILVEEALRLARARQATTVADIGTGSGAIAIALAELLPRARIFAVDLSGQALQVARRNVESRGLGARVSLLAGSLALPLPEAPDLVVANLPYLSTGMMAELDRDMRWEPSLALHGGDTGLELYARLLAQLRGRGWLVPLALEIDPRQREGLARLVEEWWPGACLDVRPDYAGLDRVVLVQP